MVNFGNPDDQNKISAKTWLQRFKQKIDPSKARTLELSTKATGSQLTSTAKPTIPSVSDSLHTSAPEIELSSDRNSPNKPQSQIFQPTVAIEPDSPFSDSSTGQSIAKGIVYKSLSSSVQKPLIEEDLEFNADKQTAIEQPHNNPNSNTSLTWPPPLSNSVTPSSVSIHSSPTKDEALCAMRLVAEYFQGHDSGLSPWYFITIGKLMQKLESS